MRKRIVAFGVKVLAVPDPHLYFQAPGGRVFRLVRTSLELVGSCSFASGLVQT
jgi:hypothetical protein